MTMNNLSDTARKSSITGDQLRQSFLSFFAERGHAIIPSAPLVPENDPTALFISAGMQPLVPYLLGESHPNGRRLTNVQKCLRTDDIDPMKKDIRAIKDDVAKIRNTFAPRLEYDDRLRVIEHKLGIPTPKA